MNCSPWTMVAPVTRLLRRVARKLLTNEPRDKRHAQELQRIEQNIKSGAKEIYHALVKFLDEMDDDTIQSLHEKVSDPQSPEDQVGGLYFLSFVAFVRETQHRMGKDRGKVLQRLRNGIPKTVFMRRHDPTALMAMNFVHAKIHKKLVEYLETCATQQLGKFIGFSCFF